MDTHLQFAVLDDVPSFEEQEEPLADPAHELNVLFGLQSRLSALQQTLSMEGQVSSIQATTLKTLGMGLGLESIDAHFRAYPIATYTKQPSTINLRVTQEGLAAGLKEAVVKAAKAVWKFILLVFNNIKSYYTANRRKAQQAQQSARNVGTLAAANERSAALLAENDGLSQAQKDALFAEVDQIRVQVEKTFGSKWNQLLQDLVNGGLTSNNLLLFKLLSGLIHHDADRFMKSVSDFVRLAEDGLKKQQPPDVLALTLAGVNLDILRVQPEVKEQVDALLRNTSVRRADNVSDYQAAYATLMGSVKSQQSHRVPMSADLLELVKASELVQSILGQGYLEDYQATGTAMLKVTVNLDNAAKMTETLIRAGVDISSVLVEYRSLASGIQNMETTLQVIHGQVLALTSVVSQFEQRRLAVYNRYINDPQTPEGLKRELMAVRNELRRNLR